MSAMLYLLQVLNAIPQLIAAGQSVVELVQSTTGQVLQMQSEGRDPTPEEWKSLNDRINGLRAQLHAA